MTKEYSFAIKSNEGPASITVRRDGRLLFNNYDIEYDLSMVEFGEPGNNYTKISNSWGTDPIRVILERFGLLVTEAIHLVCDLTDESTEVLSEYDSISISEKDWLNQIRAAIYQMERKGINADVTDFSDFGNLSYEVQSAMRDLELIPEEIPYKPYIIGYSILDLVSAVINTKKNMVWYYGPAYPDPKDVFGDIRDVPRTHEAFLGEPVGPVIHRNDYSEKTIVYLVDAVDNILSIENHNEKGFNHPLVAWFVRRYVDCMSARAAGKDWPDLKDTK